MMVLAALNIITGIFVNDALELTKADHDVMVQARVAPNRSKFDSPSEPLQKHGQGPVGHHHPR